MRQQWTRACGFMAAVMVAPVTVGSYVTVEAQLRDERIHTLRHNMKQSSQWLSASVRGKPKVKKFKRHYRVRLWLDLGESNMTRYELDGVLHEINDVWAQAGICFEVRDARFANPPPTDLVLRFIEGGDDLSVFGMYDGAVDMWTLDRPALSASPHPVTNAAARTASHELGHALGLRHFNRRHESIDALMSSGRRGYRLESFQIDAARAAAAKRGEPGRVCAAPKLMI